MPISLHVGRHSRAWHDSTRSNCIESRAAWRNFQRHGSSQATQLRISRCLQFVLDGEQLGKLSGKLGRCWTAALQMWKVGSRTDRTDGTCNTKWWESSGLLPTLASACLILIWLLGHVQGFQSQTPPAPASGSGHASKTSSGWRTNLIEEDLHSELALEQYFLPNPWTLNLKGFYFRQPTLSVQVSGWFYRSNLPPLYSKACGDIPT